jgi:protein-S-isoprenylcysteine O-methyltransferase Ste14
MEVGMAINRDVEMEPSVSRVRFWAYWLTAVTSTLLFLFFMAAMLMVPGVLSSTKMWMLSVVGVVAAISLAVGMWRFGSTEAPATLPPLGPVAGVVLLLELVYCSINVFLLAAHP